ncbi:MAG: VOC family protein [Pseudomonadota bacterium]
MNRTLDHFLITVEDQQAAFDTYEKLGFHVRPIAKHEELGSTNCIFHFPDTYFELICLTGSPNQLIDQYRDRLELGDGISNLSLNSRDLEADHALMAEKGLNPNPILNARRKIIRPDGQEDYTASSSFYVWREDNPFVSLFLSEHKKPNTIFIKEYENHPNTAIDVTRVVYMSRQPSEDIDYFSEVWDQSPDSATDEGFVMRGARGELVEVLTVESVQHRYGDHLAQATPDPLPGLGVAMHYAVASLDTCEKVLRDGGVSFDIQDNNIVVPASQACGVVSVFEA